MKSLFNRLSIVKKMVIGYFIIVFIPVIAFGIYFYNQLYKNVIEELASSKQQVIEQAYSNLYMDLLQLESIYGLFQYNSTVVDYLNGRYDTEGEHVYHYLKEIRPIFSYALYGNANLENIRLYTNNESAFIVSDQIVRFDDLPPRIIEELRDVLPGSGKWFYERSRSGRWTLVYYQNMYAERFSKHIGVLEVRVSPRLMERFTGTLSNDGLSDVVLFTEDFAEDLELSSERMEAELLDNIRNAGNSAYFFLDHKWVIVNHLHIEKLGIGVAVISHAKDVFSGMTRQQVVLILIIAGLLLILSGIYYLLASSITKRLLRLARHMRNVGKNNFRLIHNHRENQDEIGYLTSTYNLMLQRMDELINRIQRSEMLRKEAAYRALQAQVKPHFLYNTLETIRMLAENNDDKEVADIAYSFGQLMRYSLSKQNEVVRLSDEIKYIDHYMKIHKMRLGNRLVLSYKIRTNTNRIPCPPFILQPLVENCIVHGLANKKQIRIQLKIWEDERYVHIQIEDNGTGMSEEKLHQLKQMLSADEHQISFRPNGHRHNGHGLYNVGERIKLFYGADSGLELESQEGVGTFICLHLNKKGMFRHAEVVGRR